MIDKRTVFILGAGASHPYGIPTAKDLRDKIIGEFAQNYQYLYEVRGNQPIHGVNEGYPNPSLARRFIEEFHQSSTESVDLFLSGHPAFTQIGKIAICLTMLNAEASSRFRDRVTEREKDWYFHLFNRLRRELTGKDGYREFGANRIAFITFNYDRSLEHFFFNSLLHSFEGADLQRIREQMIRIPIIHVYGKLPPLPWEENDSRRTLEYGKSDALPHLNLPWMASNLYVVREERTNPASEKVHTLIQEAERVFFLGFAYAKENLGALGLPDVLRPMQYIYGTAMGWTKKEIQDITFYVGECLGKSEKDTPNRSSQVHIMDCDSVALLREFL
jgi:hypothetical protein